MENIHEFPVEGGEKNLEEKKREAEKRLAKELFKAVKPKRDIESPQEADQFWVTSEWHSKFTKIINDPEFLNQPHIGGDFDKVTLAELETYEGHLPSHPHEERKVA